MNCFSNILFPTDGSEKSIKVLEHVKAFALNFKSKVIVVHTYELPLLINGYEMNPGIFDEMADDLKSRGEGILKEVKKELESRGIINETCIQRGNPGQIITELSVKNNCDIIIMGSRGLGSIKSVIVGSVSNYVIHHAKCPVFVIH